MSRKENELRAYMREQQRLEERRHDQAEHERRHRERLEAMERAEQARADREYERQVRQERERADRRAEREARRGGAWSAPVAARPPAPAATPVPPRNRGVPPGLLIAGGVVVLGALAGIAQASKAADADLVCRPAPTPPAPKPSSAPTPAPTPGWTAWTSVKVGAAAGLMFWIGMRLGAALF